MPQLARPLAFGERGPLLEAVSDGHRRRLRIQLDAHAEVGHEVQGRDREVRVWEKRHALRIAPGRPAALPRHPSESGPIRKGYIGGLSQRSHLELPARDRTGNSALRC